MILLVKDAAELDPAHFSTSRCAHCSGCRLLALEAVGDAVEARSRVGGASQVQSVEPGAGALRAALDEELRSHGADASAVAVVAPFFSLRKLDPEAVEGGGRVVLFANNYIAQGYKLKGSKPILNRAVCRLLRLDGESFEACPFLSRLDGIWVVDLALVPEKYRLDPGRCEELMDRFLGAWLRITDGGAGEGVN
jgi:hypothetical protein